MNRYEHYKRIRLHRRNVFLTLVLAMFLMIAGVTVSSSMTGSMMGDNSMRISSITYLGENIYSFDILGISGAVDLDDIWKEAEKVKTVFVEKIQTLLYSE